MLRNPTGDSSHLPYWPFLWKASTLVGNFSINPVPRTTTRLADEATWSATLPCHLLPHYNHVEQELTFFTMTTGIGVEWPHSLPITSTPCAGYMVMRRPSQRTVLKSSFSVYGNTSPKGVQVNTLTNRLFWRLRTKKWVRGSWPIKIMSICTVRCHFQLNQALWLVRKELERSNSKSAEKATWIYLPQCLVSLSLFFRIAPRRKQKNQGGGTVFLPHKTL